MNIVKNKWLSYKDNLPDSWSAAKIFKSSKCCDPTVVHGLHKSKSCSLLKSVLTVPMVYIYIYIYMISWWHHTTVWCQLVGVVYEVHV